MKKLYRVTTWNGVRERIDKLLENKFVSIQWPNIGDAEDASPQELDIRLARAYELEGDALAAAAADVYTFAALMRDGDYVLLEDGDLAYLGDLGDYYYVDPHLSEEDERGMEHRRGVTWLCTIPLTELNDDVRAWLREPGDVAEFGRPLEQAGLERWLANANGAEPAAAKIGARPAIAELADEALAVLRQAMRSEDPERRERAAIAILRYAAQGDSDRA